MMDQPSFSAGRSLILGRRLFMLLLNNSGKCWVISG
jgi:hypothetical protein